MSTNHALNRLGPTIAVGAEEDRRGAETGPLVEEARRLGPISRLRLLLSVFARHRRFGALVAWAVFAPIMYLCTRAAMWADLLFYPELRNVEVRKPVFVLGHPRSGSTFLQKAVHQSGKAAMFRTWELWFPSLTQRRLVRPILAFLRLLDVSILQGPESGHEIAVEGIEEDEALFLHQLDSEMLTFICPQTVTDRRYGGIGLQFGRLGNRQTRRSLRFYKACLKRQILWTGTSQVVVKCNPSVFRIPWILEEFPDARFVYLVREPTAAVRSYLALNDRHVADRLGSKEVERFHRGKYHWSVDLYGAFERYRRSVRRDRLLVLTFDELTQTSRHGLHRFFAFTGIVPNGDYWTAVPGDAPSATRGRHRNPPLAAFGIGRAEVDRDLSFVRARYLGRDRRSWRRRENGRKRPSDR